MTKDSDKNSDATKVRDQFFEFLGRVQLRGIDLQSIQASRPEVESDANGLPSLAHACEVISARITGSDIHILARHKVHVTLPQGESAQESGDKSGADIQEVLDFNATWDLTYVFSGEAPDGDVLGIFASQNATYNSWPYMRELLDSMCGRMSRPRLVAPLFKPRLPF